MSGGERARVALARVLAQRKPLLLLDEPTAALDLRHQELVLRLCRERARAGDAMVVVLHDLAPAPAAAYADRVAVLRSGRVTAEGVPAEVFAEELLSEVYDQPVEVFPHPRTGAPAGRPAPRALAAAPGRTRRPYPDAAQTAVPRPAPDGRIPTRP